MWCICMCEIINKILKDYDIYNIYKDVIDKCLTDTEIDNMFNKYRDNFSDERDKYKYLNKYVEKVKSKKEVVFIGSGSPIEISSETGFPIPSLTLGIYLLCRKFNIPFTIWGLKGNDNIILNKSKRIKLKLWEYIGKIIEGININPLFITKVNIDKYFPINNKDCLVLSHINGVIDSKLDYLKVLHNKFPSNKTLFNYMLWTTFNITNKGKSGILEWLSERKIYIPYTKIFDKYIPIRKCGTMYIINCKFPNKYKKHYKQF